MSRKPPGYWTYEHCLEEAKKCKTRTEFQKCSKVAYMVSLQNNWISEFTWFELKVRPRGYWNHDRCYKEAQKYRTKHEFELSSKGAYNASLANNWMQEFTWFIERKKSNGYWDYEHCHEEAQKFRSRRAFQKGAQFAYKVSCENKWIDDWFTSTTGKKWNAMTCVEESKKYDTRSSFMKGSSGAYSVAKANGWLDSYTWLKDGRLKLFTDKVDCVYAYEFPELNSVYIGRTLMRQQEQRDRQHLWKDDTVARFIKAHNIPMPVMKVLEKNLTIEEGSTREGDYVEIYRHNGWTILNKAKTGAIGSIGKGKWNRETCFEEAKKYTTYRDFRVGNHRAHQVALQNGWINDYTWLEHTQKPRGYWTKEMCFEEASKYKTLKDMLAQNGTLYRIAYKNGWLKEYTWLKREVKPRGYWTKERCIEEAKKYKSKKELVRNNSSVYVISRKNGWLDEFFPK